MGLFNPKNAEAGKGFLEGRNIKITDAAYVVHDGEGNWERESTCLWLEMTDMDGKLEDPVDQYYSIGSPADFIPKDNGTRIDAKKGMSQICNLYHFTVSLANAGMPDEVLDALADNAKVLVGLEGRMGTTIRSKKDKKGLATIDEIFVMPGENDPESIARKVVAEVLGGNGGQVGIKTLPKKITEALEGYDAGVAKAVKKKAISKKFLNDNFVVEGNTVALA